MFRYTNIEVDADDFLPFIEPSAKNINELINVLPNHKLLFLSGNDFPRASKQERLDCNKSYEHFLKV